LIFWRWAQALFFGPSENERESILRKFYLYAVIFIAVLGTVTNIAFILAGFFRRLLDLPPMGDLRDPLPIIIGMSLLWAYHAYVLNNDAKLVPEAPRQAGVRRLYLYLVAAIGLAAFLVGLSSDISVLIQALADQSFASGLKEQLAWSTAALLAGLPVWLWPWRLVQLKAVAPGPEGAEERQSLVRKIYLYFYLFVATMTVLSSAIYIVFQLLSLVLGGRDATNLLSDLGHAIAFGLIAVGVWLYHGLALRDDGRLNQRDQSDRLTGWRVALVDKGEGEFGRAALDRLRHELPDLSLEPIGLTEQAAQAMGATTGQGNILAQLAGVQLIVGPWDMTVEGNGVPSEVARAIVTNPARKLLVPVRAGGWEWAGVDRWNADSLVQQTVHAVKQIVTGEEVKPARGLSIGLVIGIVAGLFFLLIFGAIPLLIFSSF
jgi:hypothetical protein